MGKREMESVIHEEIRDLLNEVKRCAGPDWNNTVLVRDLVSATGANVIYHMLTGRRFKLTDPELKKLMDIIRSLTSLINASGGLAGSMPILLRVLPALTEYPESLKYRNQLYTFLTVIFIQFKIIYNIEPFKIIYLISNNYSSSSSLALRPL